MTLAEMHKIEAYKAEGYSNRQIAKLLERCPQTIHHVIKTGFFPQKLLQEKWSPDGAVHQTKEVFEPD